MKNENIPDFWIGTAIGIAAGAFGYYLFMQYSPAAANAALPAPSQTVSLNGSAQSVQMKVGNALTLQSANGNFAKLTFTGADVFQEGAPSAGNFSSLVLHASTAGSVAVTATDAAGTQSVVYVTVS